jgi:hypothetical protein
MILTCGECGGKVSTNAKQCPHCGKPGPFAPPAPPQKSDPIVAWTISIVITLVGLGLLLKFFN